MEIKFYFIYKSGFLGILTKTHAAPQRLYNESLLATTAIEEASG